MKSRVIKIMLSIVYSTLGAVSPSIQFPPKLGGVYEKEFDLEFHRPVSAVEDGKISLVIVQGNYKVNGKLLRIPDEISNRIGERGERVKGFRGAIQFLPSIDVDQIHNYLDNARLDSIEERDGRYEVAYVVDGGTTGKKRHLKPSTEQSGRLYQCPLPHLVKVGGHVKTPFIHLQSLPVCHGLNDKECQKMRQEAYVHKNNTYSFSEDQSKVTVAPLGEAVLSKGYSHSTLGGLSPRSLTPDLLKYCTHGKVSAEINPMVLTDITAKIPNAVPLLWDTKKDQNGNSHLYTYKHYGLCGDKILNSKPFAWEVEKPSIAIPGAHHMGFKTEEKQTLRNSQGDVAVPPLYATKFTQEDDKTITMICMYGDPRVQEDALVLSASLEVPAAQCYLYGKDAATSREYEGVPLRSKYTINKDITVVSRTDQRAEAPVALHVVPPAVVRY